MVQQKLILKLAGSLRLTAGHGVDLTPKSVRAKGVLALLAMAPGYRRSRLQLQDKLWSESGPEQAGGSLRQTLTDLRKALGEDRDALVSDRSSVGLDPERLTVRIDPEAQDWELTGEPPEFCAGLDIPDPEFEDWIRDQRFAFADRCDALEPPALPERLVAFQPGVAEAFGPPSIAVMPPVVLSEEGRGGFIATALGLDVIGRLTRFKRIDAIAWSSTAALEPSLSPRQIGQALKARYVVQTALRLARTRMRLTVDLIESDSEKMVWSQSFNREFEDVFDVEEEIAEAVVAAMMIEIDRLERVRAHARDPSSLDAYALCLKGLDEIGQRQSLNCDAAERLFARALELQPYYARAIAGLSRVHSTRWRYHFTRDRPAAMARAADVAADAIDADPNDARAHAELGWVRLYRREFDASMAAYARAVELNPGDAEVLFEYATALGHDGEPAEALPLFERAVRLNPQRASAYLAEAAASCFCLERYEDALGMIGRMNRPEMGALIAAATHAMLGNADEAQRLGGMLRAQGAYPPAEEWIKTVPNRPQEYQDRLLRALKLAGL